MKISSQIVQKKVRSCKKKYFLICRYKCSNTNGLENTQYHVSDIRSRQTKTIEKSKHGDEEVIYNFGESEPEEINKDDEVSPQKNKSSLKRRRSSKFWEYIEIDEPEDEFVNKQPINNTTEYSDDGDDKPIAAVRSSSRRSQAQASEKSKQTAFEFANKQLTKNEESEPEENIKDEASSPEENTSSRKRRTIDWRSRSSKYWEYKEIDKPEDEFVNKQRTNTTENSDDGDDNQQQQYVLVVEDLKPKHLKKVNKWRLSLQTNS